MGTRNVSANGRGIGYFTPGGVNFRLGDYLSYANSNCDPQPLYLFDPTFARSAPELLSEYEPPIYFRDDLFSLLDEYDGGPRPDYRWLLIGGLRSGQSWHKDPNGTSAWNLTLRGRKRWLFFPPNVTPPGVMIKPGGGGNDFITPISLEEWARGFYAESRSTPGFLETETGEGDAMFVPRGWWHMVLNVRPATIAISHHFLSPAGLANTIRVLRDTPHEVSGVDRGLAPWTSDGVPNPDAGASEDHRRRAEAGRALHDRLISALRARRPEALDRAEEELKERRRRDGRMAGAATKKKRSALKALVGPGRSGKRQKAFAFNFAH